MIAQINSNGLRVIISLVLLALLAYIPSPAFSQEPPEAEVTLPTAADLLVNGSFEEGFQGQFGVGYGWGGFSNGNAEVGWNDDTWEQTIVEGEHSQLIQIQNAIERDRYAGIYQTVPVVKGAQYQLRINGVIRSAEGSIEKSNYGYRLQYAIDYSGGTNWEAVGDTAWRELSWDEQPLYEPNRLDSFEGTITARSEQITIFIRGWKKWADKGVGIFNIDEVSLVGPSPQKPTAQEAAAGGTTDQAGAAVSADGGSPAGAGSATTTGGGDTPASPQAGASQLPVSGQGQDETASYMMVVGLGLVLLLLLGGAVATVRHYHSLSDIE